MISGVEGLIYVVISKTVEKIGFERYGGETP